MSETPANIAWIEKPDGERVVVGGNLALGRTLGSDLVLPDERVSRRHAIVHAQGQSEFWLVDHGSRNGTYVNDRRVLQPCRLRDGDRIRIGPFVLTFRQAGEPGDASAPETGSTVHTLVDMQSAPCWLLVADVQGSTQLAQSVPPDAFAKLLGGWFKRCQKLVEASGGTVNKYLGDGFLAFWRSTATPVSALGMTIRDMHQLQQAGRPPFRFVVHHGGVLLGGAGTMGEDSLSGPSVNFVFRLEKVAGTLGEPCVVSAAAAEQCEGVVKLRALGSHPVPSFEGEHVLFGL